MTMAVERTSQHIRQKSTKVFGNGPGHDNHIITYISNYYITGVNMQI